MDVGIWAVNGLLIEIEPVHFLELASILLDCAQHKLYENTFYSFSHNLTQILMYSTVWIWIDDVH